MPRCSLLAFPSPWHTSCSSKSQPSPNSSLSALYSPKTLHLHSLYCASSVCYFLHCVPLQNNECNFRKDILHFFHIEVESQIVLNVKFRSASMTEANLQIGSFAQTVFNNRTLLVLCKAKQSSGRRWNGKAKSLSGFLWKQCSFSIWMADSRFLSYSDVLKTCATRNKISPHVNLLIPRFLFHHHPHQAAVDLCNRWELLLHPSGWSEESLLWQGQTVWQDGISDRGDAPQLWALPAATEPSSLGFLDEGPVKCSRIWLFARGTAACVCRSQIIHLCNKWEEAFKNLDSEDADLIPSAKSTLYMEQDIQNSSSLCWKNGWTQWKNYRIWNRRKNYRICMA